MESYLKKIHDKEKEKTLEEESASKSEPKEESKEDTNSTQQSSEHTQAIEMIVEGAPLEENFPKNKEDSQAANKKKHKKLGILAEKEHLEKFKSYFQSPTLNRALGDFLSLNLKTLREENDFSPISDIKPFVMGICGGTSAGKSQIVKMIAKSLHKRKNTDKVTFLSEENFFKSKELHCQEKEIDFDHPDNVDWKVFSLALDSLLKRQKFEIPLFDMNSEERKKEKKLLEPTDLIIVEGRLVFFNEEIRKKCDLKIFLDTDEDVRLSRRVYKDVMIRKKKVEDVIDRYLKYVKPDFEKFVLPSKKYADIIIPNYGGGFSNEMPENEIDHDEIGFNQFDHAAVGLIIDQVYKKVKKIKDFRQFKNEENNREKMT